MEVHIKCFLPNRLIYHLTFVMVCLIFSVNNIILCVMVYSVIYLLNVLLVFSRI